MNKTKETWVDSQVRTFTITTLEQEKILLRRGFDAGQAQLLEQAASGFGEWFDRNKNRLKVKSLQGNISDFDRILIELWQASALNSALHSTKLLAEKDAEIENIKNALGAMTERARINGEIAIKNQDQFSQAKELIKVMCAVIWCDNAKQWHRENTDKIKALLGEE